MTLQEKVEELMSLYREVKREIRQKNKQLFERWKAGGCMVDGDFVGMYPALEEVAELLWEEEEEDSEE